MKVLVYTHEFPPFLGGLATTSYKLAKGITDSCADVTVLAPAYGEGDRLEDKLLESRVIKIPGLGRKWVKLIPFFDIILGLFYLLATLLQKKPDIVLFITEEAEAAGGLLPYFPFKPVVRVAGSGITTCFYGNRFFKRIMRFSVKRLYEHSQLIITFSKISMLLSKVNNSFKFSQHMKFSPKEINTQNYFPQE